MIAERFKRFCGGPKTPRLGLPIQALLVLSNHRPRGHRTPLGTTHVTGAVPSNPLLQGPPRPVTGVRFSEKNLLQQLHRDRVYVSVRKTIGRGQSRCLHAQSIYCMTAQSRGHHEVSRNQRVTVAVRSTDHLPSQRPVQKRINGKKKNATGELLSKRRQSRERWRPLRDSAPKQLQTILYRGHASAGTD